MNALAKSACIILLFTLPYSGLSATTNAVLNLTAASPAFVAISDTPTIQLAQTNYSMAAWVRLDQYDTFGSAIIAKRSNGSKRGYMLNVAGTAQGAEARKLSLIVSEGANPRIYSPNDFPTGSWHHVAATFDLSSGEANLYMDGYCEATAILPSPLASSAVLYVGRDSKANQYYFKGQMDEVQIWTKVLSPIEIKGIMQNGPEGSEPGLEALWLFDTINATDSTIHAHNGSLGGAATFHLESAPSISMNWAVEIPFLSASPMNHYRLQYATDITSTNWFNVGPTIRGNGAVQSLYDSAPLGTRRYYRIAQE